jgi:hypothetical protein
MIVLPSGVQRGAVFSTVSLPLRAPRTGVMLPLPVMA